MDGEIEFMSYLGPQKEFMETTQLSVRFPHPLHSTPATRQTDGACSASGLNGAVLRRTW